MRALQAIAYILAILLVIPRALPLPAAARAGARAGRFRCRSRDLLMSSEQGKLKMWNLARSQVGLPPLAMSLPLKSFIDQFLDTDHGVVPVGINDTAVSFLIVFKGANDNIRKNLNLFKTLNISSLPLKDGYRAESEEVFRQFAQLFSPPRVVESFTFVREPLSHFRSGFREYMQRCPEQLRVFNESSNGIVNSNFIKDQIRRILSGLRNAVPCRGAGFHHLFAMSGVIKPHWNLSFVGHIEQFDEDWDKVQKMYGISVPNNHSIGSHASSTDRHGVEPAFRELQESEPGYVRALCVILYYDFLCFGYELPVVCSGVQPTIKISYR